MRIIKADRRAGVAFAAAALAVLSVAGPASADGGKDAGQGTAKVTPGTTFTVPAKDGSGADKKAAANAVVCASPNRKANFLFQSDGNLVDYDENGNARWASNTDGRGYSFVFQADGNAVVYDVNGHPLWASNTDGHPNDWLICQDDGNVVIYDPGPTALWATGTNH